MKKPSHAQAVHYLRGLAAHLKGYSNHGQYMNIPGPSARRAWEFGEEIEMAIEALTEPMPPLPTINPELIPSKEKA
jgi:hypothetical protein